MRVDLDFFCAFAVAVSFRSMCQSLLLETLCLLIVKFFARAFFFCESILVHLSFFSVRDLFSRVSWRLGCRSFSGAVFSVACVAPQSVSVSSFQLWRRVLFMKMVFWLGLDHLRVCCGLFSFLFHLQVA